jgi:iron complex outermembrane recepter protein
MLMPVRLSKIPHAPSVRSGTRALLLVSAIGAMLAPDFTRAEGLEEIVVTARKREENVQNIPVAVTAISAAQLDNYSLRSLEQIAASTPELTVVRGSSGSGATLSLRGIGSSFTSIGIEQSVAVNVDGVYYGQGRVINEGFFDMKQVEILKGPQALFFGKNSTAGVISFTSADPGKEFEAMARAGYEFESRTPSVEAVVSGPVSDTFGLRLAIRGADMQGGYVENQAPDKTYTTLNLANFASTIHNDPAPQRDVPGEQDFMARLTAKYTPSDDLSVTLKGTLNRYRINDATWSNLMYSCPGVAAGILGPQGIPAGTSQLNHQSCSKNWVIQQNDVPPDIAATNPLLNRHGGSLYQDYDAFGFTSDVAYHLSSVDLSAVMGYYNFTNYFLGDYDASGATDGGTWGAERSAYDAFSTELRAQTKLDSPVNFMVGGYFQKTTLDFHQLVIFPGGLEDSSVADPSLRYITLEKKSYTDGSTAAGFGQVIWDFQPGWEFTGGARYTHETKDSEFRQPYVVSAYQAVYVQGTPLAANQKFHNVSPEATLTWKAADNVTVYGAYKQGYKSGGFSGSALYSTNTTVKDLAFNPEKAKGFEVGIKSTWLGGRLRFDADVFQYHYDDLQIDFFDSAKLAFVTLNAGSSRTQGVETQLEWAATQSLVLRGTAAYDQARYQNFSNAPCYAGQSIEEGCTPGVSPTQNLSGKPTANAPKVTASLGGDYDLRLGGSLLLALSANMHFSSSYSLTSFANPDAEQGAYGIVDGAVRFGNDTRTWEVALIGKNLTNRFVLNSGGDGTSSGGNTGGSSAAPVSAATAYRADQTGTVNLPRTFELQATVRF